MRSASGSGAERDLVERVALLALAATLATVVVIAFWWPWAHGDSAGLAVGAQGIVDCLKHARFTGCDRLPNGLTTQMTAHGYVGGKVNPYPLLQYIPATALRAAGDGFRPTLHKLIDLDALALVGTVAVCWFTASRVASRAWAPALAAALIASPLLWYATAAFGEELAAFVAVLSVAAVALRARPAIVAPLAAVACFGKETHGPFVLALGLLTALAVWDDLAAARPTILALVLGCAAGVAINALFNVFRFGSLLNSTYVEPAFRVHSPTVAANLFAALWASPNGGLLWWWPAALGLLFLCAIGASSRRARRDFGARGALAGWAVLALLAIDLAGLAVWWSPFGWTAWGPRLSLPLLPAMLLAAVVTCGERAAVTMARAFRRVWFWCVVGAITILAIPQMAVLFSPSPFGPLFRKDATCHGSNVIVDPRGFYRCTEHTAWTKRPILIHGGAEAFHGWGIIASACFVVAFVSLLLLARARSQDATRSTPEPSQATT